MAQTLVNGTAKTNTINAKELYSSEAGTCEAAREPASKGSDTTLSKKRRREPHAGFYGGFRFRWKRRRPVSVRITPDGDEGISSLAG